MIPRRTTSRVPLARAAIAAAALAYAAAACSASQPGWTYDPSIGQPTGGIAAAGSGGASEAGSAGASAVTESPAASGAAGSPAGSGAALALVAKNVAFDQQNLTATAGAAFQIQFDNQDAGIPHNVAIYGGSSPTNNLFRGTIVNGPGQATYDVPALPAGTYQFQCDVHPTQMKGTIVIH